MATRIAIGEQMMRTTVIIATAAAFIAVAAVQVPNAALALNPQPEVPSKPNPGGCTKCKHKKKGHKPSKGPKHTPPNPIKR
jgi:hypothetical protein